jgi:hypothetical protein
MICLKKIDEPVLHMMRGPLTMATLPQRQHHTRMERNGIDAVSIVATTE